MWHAWESKEKCTSFGGKAQRKSPLGGQRRRWEDVIGTDLKETDWAGVDWIRLSQDRDRWRAVVNVVLNLRVLVPRSQSVSQSSASANCCVSLSSKYISPL
jgi:hypothetical protein